jgi:3-hydroxy-9,10-secoandrosta-1,3,5(10)-triene-9,17-dione monooxygenase
MNETKPRAFARDVAGLSPAEKPIANILYPVVQSGSVDVSDIAHLTGAALRKVLVERAAALVPLLESNAQATENARRVVDENIAAIRDAGLYKIMVPRRFGGLETDIRTKLEVTRELAKGCGSTAWVTTLLNVCAWFAGLASAQAQEDIWGANPEARVAGVFAALGKTKRVEGGFVVSGKWPWASGCLHADWAMLGMPIIDEAGVEIDQGLAFISMSEVTIEDTWFVTGMKGTGSNTIVAENVFVPEHRIMSISRLLAGDPPTPYKDEVLYRCAFMPVAAIVLAGSQLGLCSRALDFVIEKAPKRSISYTFYKTQTESPSFQLAVAKAAMLVDSAHLHAYRTADEIYDAAGEGRFPSYVERAKSRFDAGYVGQLARDAIDVLMSAHGASSFAEVSPMQRIWRDSETAGRHAVISPDIGAEVFGRALLGYTDGITALV